MNYKVHGVVSSASQMLCCVTVMLCYGYVILQPNLKRPPSERWLADCLIQVDHESDVNASKEEDRNETNGHKTFSTSICNFIGICDTKLRCFIINMG